MFQPWELCLLLEQKSGKRKEEEENEIKTYKRQEKMSSIPLSMIYVYRMYMYKYVAMLKEH